jgi:hypothetical protein
MVLCPFVFLYTSHALPPLRLQPTEVASAHWVPIRALLSPSLQSFEYCDVSDRLTKRGGIIVRMFLRAMFGQMMFAAVRLTASESHFCSFTSEFLPEERPSTGMSTVKRLVKEWWLGDHAGSANPTRPLLLWGLTLGVVLDFLDLIPPHSALQLWTWPTFMLPDVRFILWVMTYKFRDQKKKLVKRELRDPSADALDYAEASHNKVKADPLSKDVDRDVLSLQSPPRSATVGLLLEGYFDLVRKGVAVSLLARFLSLAAIFAYVVPRRRR